jgi:hypothetical protein
MRRDGLNDFYEVNFLRLREIDATYPSEPIRYVDLADIYSFISLKKYRLINFPLKKEKRR